MRVTRFVHGSGADLRRRLASARRQGDLVADLGVSRARRPSRPAAGLGGNGGGGAGRQPVGQIHGAGPRRPRLLDRGVQQPGRLALAAGAAGCRTLLIGKKEEEEEEKKKKNRRRRHGKITNVNYCDMLFPSFYFPYSGFASAPI